MNINNPSRISGYIVRHNTEFDIKNKNNNEKFNQLVQILNFKNSLEKLKFKTLCDKLVIGLRDRYSGNQETNVKKKIALFSKEKNTLGILNINLERISTLLQNILRNNTNMHEDSLASLTRYLVALCTHRHTTLSSVTSYPRTLQHLFKAINIEYSNSDLHKVKIDLENFSLWSPKDLNDGNWLTTLHYQMSLSFHDLRGFDFSHTNLDNNDLSYADLRGLDLSNTSLNGADLRNANLSNANLSNTGLCYAKLSYADLSNTGLRYAKLSYADLRNTRLNGADLRNADLNNTRLNGADLRNANLSYADLPYISILGAKFNQTNLTDAQMTINFTDNLDLEFNHFNNPSGSTLTAINSIDDIYEDLKYNLMLQAIEFLEGENISSIIEPLLDILLNNDFYLKNPQIREFIVTRLLFYKIDQANNNPYTFKNKELDILLHYIQSLDNELQHGLMENQNTFFVQLLNQSANTEDNNIKDCYNDLRSKYDNYLNNLNMLGDSINAFYDGENDYILIKDNKALMVSNNYLSKFLYNKDSEGVNWDNFYYIVDQEVQNLSNINLDDIFSIFTIFQARYTFEKNKSKFLNLLNSHNLPFNYLTIFKEALSKKKSMTDKLTSNHHQIELRRTYNQLLMADDNINENEPCSLVSEQAKSISLTNDHFLQIATLFDLNNEEYTTFDQAQILLLLSGIFAKFSSSSFFGEALNSPEALRYYAYALMKKAHSINSNIFADKSFAEWTNKFLGIGNEFTCTAILSNLIINHCKSFNNPKLLGILPPAWQ